MSEPLDLNGSNDDMFEARLRTLSVAPAALDRDRLMHLAGQRSVTAGRRAKPFWPAMTAASWAACATVAFYAITRPPQIVTQVRIVERIVEAPAVTVPTRAPIPKPPVIAEQVPANENAGPADDADFRFLDDIRHPLTALASRPSLFAKLADNAAVASVDSSPAEVIPPARLKTQLDLRRELLESDFEPNHPRVWWF